MEIARLVAKGMDAHDDAWHSMGFSCHLPVEHPDRLGCTLREKTQGSLHRTRTTIDRALLIPPMALLCPGEANRHNPTLPLLISCYPFD